MFPLLGETMVMVEVFKRMQRAAEVDSPVLIWGERGSGKQLVAETIHHQSRRAAGPFVEIDTQAARSAALEAELLGCFPLSSASSGPKRRGWHDTLHGGTLLIKEVTGLGNAAQARLSNLLEHQARTAGSSPAGARPAFRWMATTCYDPVQSVEQGAIREDLYYRLAIVVIRLPPLRERRADIPLLVRHFLAQQCKAHDRPAPVVEPALMEMLAERRAWPGNLDELCDCVGSMLTAREGDTLQPHHLFGLRHGGTSSFLSGETR